MSPPRALILTNVLAPYRQEFYRRLSSLPDWEVAIWFGGDRRLSAKWQWHPQTGIRGQELPRLFLGRYAWNPTLAAALRRYAPTVIVVGGVSPAALTACRYAARRGIPLLIWWGGTADSEANVPTWQRALRQRVFARASGFLTYSAFATDYLRNHARVTQPIFTLGNNTMDARAWHERVTRAKPTTPPPRPIILCVGQLVPRKGYDIAVRAAAPLLAKLPFELVLAGDGVELPRLRQLATELGIAEHVRFTGHLSHADTVPWYAAATIFFHPARRDQWPQVVNEALAASLPVLLSSSSGIPPDFVTDNHNGFVRPAEDVPGWTACLQRLLANPELRERFAVQARATAQARDVEFAVAEFRRALREVAQQ